MYLESASTNNPFGKTPNNVTINLAGQLYGKNQNKGVKEKNKPPDALANKFMITEPTNPTF
ncbi:hypothetical protein GCM10010912_46490 [Paenibacillus albidus]|uniref:Uncharacterized protein n=1 Tax=Paenibacillus albidus TaxID=2041023 RepID=A0A917CUB0_9BACL|nr:hypothetical protein GCM10010912_46490 [Paenibacillus albidus]